LLLSSPEEKLWFSALARAKRFRPLWFICLPEEKKGGRPPKLSEALGLRSWAFIPESTGRLSSKIPCAKIKSDDLSSYVP